MYMDPVRMTSFIWSIFTPDIAVRQLKASLYHCLPLAWMTLEQSGHFPLFQPKRVRDAVATAQEQQHEQCV
jgi:hypothetical protein